jgi:predicted Na+-dependent transporter
LPAVALDVILLKYKNHKNDGGNGSNAAAAIIHSDKRYLVASMVISSFFITLFFPWTVDVFGGFFKPSDELRTEQFLLKILLPIILPIVIPVALLSSFMGGYVVQKLHKKNKPKLF